MPSNLTHQFYFFVVAKLFWHMGRFADKNNVNFPLKVFAILWESAQSNKFENKLGKVVTNHSLKNQKVLKIQAI